MTWYPICWDNILSCHDRLCAGMTSYCVWLSLFQGLYTKKLCACVALAIFVEDKSTSKVGSLSLDSLSKVYATA